VQNLCFAWAQYMGVSGNYSKDQEPEKLWWKSQPEMSLSIEINRKKPHIKSLPKILTHRDVVIRLLTPTQDLVFARAIKGHAVGGRFQGTCMPNTAAGADQATRGSKQLQLKAPSVSYSLLSGQGVENIRSAADS
jgi:hypothetical protein